MREELMLVQRGGGPDFIAQPRSGDTDSGYRGLFEDQFDGVMYGAVNGRFNLDFGFPQRSRLHGLGLVCSLQWRQEMAAVRPQLSQGGGAAAGWGPAVVKTR